jgi:glutathione-regulated potassium-efflux system ancillary protein KefG
LFAHPRLEKSRANRALLRHVLRLPELTVHDLYERYPDFDIAIADEQRRLLERDTIVWHHLSTGIARRRS